MSRSTDVKERIIEVTTDLIEKNAGETKNITARLIANQAGVGLGLINYHFGGKENLITECVQRIIGEVVNGFHFQREFDTDKERLTAWAVYVFDFLFQRPAISRISILGDLEKYNADCNSVLTQRGFSLALKNNVDEGDKAIAAFVLTAAMQTAFLGSGAAKEILGYDFTKPEDRKAFIEKLAGILFDGAGKRNE